MRRNDANITLEPHERFRIELLWLHDRRIHVRENPDLARPPDIVAVRRHSVADHSLPHLPVRKRLDHLVLQRFAPDPPVWLDGHPFLPKMYLRFVSSIGCCAKMIQTEAPKDVHLKLPLSSLQ